MSRGLHIALICLFLAGCVSSPFYYPDTVVYGSPANAGLRFENVAFVSQDGTKLAGWFIPAAGYANPREAKGTVVHFHGNAQNMTSHREFVGWLPRRGYNVFVFDYRGYGASQGSPEPKGVFEDSNAALNHVRSRPDVDPARLLVFGQSLGGTNAIAVVGAGNRAGVKAVAIEATFHSYSAIANDKISNTGWLVDDTYSADRYIAAIAPIPLLLVHGTSDGVIPHAHSRRWSTRRASRRHWSSSKEQGTSRHWTRGSVRDIGRCCSVSSTARCPEAECNGKKCAPRLRGQVVLPVALMAKIKT